MTSLPGKSDEASIKLEPRQTVDEVNIGPRMRSYRGPFALFVTLVCVAMSLFHLYSTVLGTFDALFIRAAFLIFVMVLGYALYPARSGRAQEEQAYPPLTDALLMVMGAGVGFYVLVNYERILVTVGSPSNVDVVVGSVAILLVLELCRRAAGPILASVCALFLLYALCGNYIPGFFGHRGYDFVRLVSHMYLTTEGIFGICAGVATNYVFLFILFGAFLSCTGAGRFFIDLAVALLGNFSGGPAKVAVFASCLMGTINGSSTANVVGTGAFTIPLMKSIGYQPHFAGAVEAAASTGGMLMPPIMGAGAFLMSEITGVPYMQIIAAAALPAILYYVGVLTGVHLEAKRTGLKGLPRESLPDAVRLIKERCILLAPIAAVVWALLQGFTPPYAAITGIATSIVAGAILPSTRVHPFRYWDALVQGPKDALGVCIACIAIGFILGSATLTGAGLKLANGILLLSGGNLFLILFFTMVASLVLGMGLPTTANYLVTSTLAAPALLKAGVAVLPAHLFCFYFGIIADITPPVALAAMAGAGLAGSPPFKTGVQAFKLAAPAYLIPYVFVYAPQITLIGYDFWSGVQASFTAILGVMCLGISIMGWMFTAVPWWQRVPLFGAALMLMVPGPLTDLTGIALLAVVAFLQRRVTAKAEASVVAPAPDTNRRAAGRSSTGLASSEHLE